jgi:hypothetical protein
VYIQSARKRLEVVPDEETRKYLLDLLMLTVDRSS